MFGQATGCLATAVRGDGRTLVPAPPHLGAAAAAAVPTVYLTADACLRSAARLQAGQTVLIHAATGWCALAATPFARCRGGVCLQACWQHA